MLIYSFYIKFQLFVNMFSDYNSIMTSIIKNMAGCCCSFRISCSLLTLHMLWTSEIVLGRFWQSKPSCSFCNNSSVLTRQYKVDHQNASYILTSQADELAISSKCRLLPETPQQPLLRIANQPLLNFFAKFLCLQDQTTSNHKGAHLQESTHFVQWISWDR